MIIERKWAMPNKWTFTIKPIKELLCEEISNPLHWVDPFSGMNSPAFHSNDLNPECKCTQNMDALEFLKKFRDEEFEGALFDPPYSITQATECYKSFGKEKLKTSVSSMAYWASVKDQLARVLKRGGKSICFGWSSMGLGKSRGFEMKRILLVPHGGSKNDTIVTVEIKK